MEVLSFIVSDKTIVEHFRSFIKLYEQLLFDCSVNDTEYYINPNTRKNEIYFHFNILNTFEELKYNYTKEEQQEIKDYFNDVPLFIFDIQFKTETILNMLLHRFNIYLLNIWNNLNEKVLLSYPNGSIIQLEKVAL